VKRVVVRVAPLQAAKLVGVLYVILGAIGVPFFLLAVGDQIPLGFAILIPLLYGLSGFIGTLVMCWLYNVLAARLGGVEVEVSEA